MLQPKRTKFRKPHRGHLRGKASRGNKIVFGEYALQALEPCWITSRQIESGRRVLTRYVKRGGKLWIRIFPDRPVTKKPAEVKMGKGKGDPQHFVCEIFPGRVIFEVDGVTEIVAREALRKAGTKLPVTTKIVARD